jgi:hypothetical protein
MRSAVEKCCEQQVTTSYKTINRRGEEEIRNQVRLVNITKIEKDDDGNKDGWYLMVEYLIIMPIRQCVFCHKDLK